MAACNSHGFYFPTSNVNGQLYLNLNNGLKMPMVGLGTWQCDDNNVKKAVRSCIKAGYRLIDTAYNYENEGGIGEELEALFKEGAVKREDLFVTTKLHPKFLGRDDPMRMIKQQLEKLKLSYVDLFLIHWPMSFLDDSSSGLFPVQDGLLKYDYSKHYTETWKGMEDVYRHGLAKSIGISNFNIHQVENVLLRSNIRPAVLQIESHPYLVNSKLIQWCQLRNIAITAYSPFANPANSWAPIDSPKYPKTMEDATLKAIASKYPGKTPAHVMLRWQIQRGVAVIPKSIHEERIKANLNVFDFQLSKEDMEAINGLDKGIRVCAFTNWGNSSSRDYPFDDYRDAKDVWA